MHYLYMCILFIILKIPWTERVTNEEEYQRINTNYQYR